MKNAAPPPTSYVGRFAPSPTGPLHLGSLFTAIASYLDARRACGRWLVRIDDIDPPREPPGASDAILRTLEAYGLEWDGSVLFQSTRLAAYAEAAERLVAEGRAFRCSCSRKDVRSRTGGARRYPGTCRNGPARAGPTAVRMRVDPGVVALRDTLQGPVEADLHAAEGDYVIFRRDGLPAYHLAVVVDDAYQGVTHVVRGADLLPMTPVHLHLQRALGLGSPRYAHLPVLVDAAGVKLSKQTGAPALPARYDAATALRVLHFLELEPPRALAGAPVKDLWAWAIDRWCGEELIGVPSIHSQ